MVDSITLVSVVEHEDGSATLTLDITEEGSKIIFDVGMKALLFMGAANTTLTEMYDLAIANREENDKNDQDQELDT